MTAPTFKPGDHLCAPCYHYAQRVADDPILNMPERHDCRGGQCVCARTHYVPGLESREQEQQARRGASRVAASADHNVAQPVVSSGVVADPALRALALTQWAVAAMDLARAQREIRFAGRDHLDLARIWGLRSIDALEQAATLLGVPIPADEDAPYIPGARTTPRLSSTPTSPEPVDGDEGTMALAARLLEAVAARSPSAHYAATLRRALAKPQAT